MDPPEVVDAVLDRLLVAVLAHEGGCNGEEGHILRFKLEHSYIYKKRAVD